MSHMTRATAVVSSPAAAALLLTAVTVYLIYLILVGTWSIAPVATTTIDECGPGENPRTSICYDADLPNK